MASDAGNAAKAAAAMVAAAAGETTTVTETTDHTGEMTTITMTIREIEGVRVDPHGIEEDATRGNVAPPHQTHAIAIGL